MADQARPTLLATAVILSSPVRVNCCTESSPLPFVLTVARNPLLSQMLHSGDLSSSMESLAYDSSVTSPGVQGSQQRTKRMRTSFKHHQLRTMKSYFNINQNPDAKDLKQLAQKTGLSKRVLQETSGADQIEIDIPRVEQQVLTCWSQTAHMLFVK
ncbi:LIM/homeobox protein Lhx2 [Homalodisca vitripennis]|nr:LIM/homeobox protein Lhx2 [Homalodisca vitripennis]